MFKQIVTLMRGRTYEAQEAVVDANALSILRQQIRDCAEAVNASRRAVAVAIAQNDYEINQCKKVQSRIVDLEARAMGAIEQDKLDLAKEAAEAIAHLEMERDASLAAQANFCREINRLKSILRNSEARLKDIDRGHRLATVTEKTQNLRERGTGSTLNALQDAEATLARLQIRQHQIDVAADVMNDFDKSADPSALVEKLAAAGCGAPTKSAAEDVLRRLQARVKTSI